MPIIARVGRKATKVRALIIFVYAALIIGSITTVYPFWLMLVGSVSSNHTAQEFRLIPRYFYSERALFEAHIWLKYYRYGGIGDIATHWKVTIPGTYGNTRNRWRLAPGERPGPEQPIARLLMNEFCALPFDRFRLEYEARGAPATWTPEFAELVADVYPFALQEVRRLVESAPPYTLQRHALLQVLRSAFEQRLTVFAQVYDAAGQPDSRSAEFATIAEQFPFLCRQPYFLALMREFSLCRKPDLDDPRVRARIDDYYAFRETLPISHRDCFWIGGHRTFQGDIDYRKWLRKRYNSLDALNKTYGTDVETWVRVFAPWDYLNRRSMYVDASPKMRDWYEWKLQLPARMIRPVENEYEWAEFLRKRHDREIVNLNRAYGTDFVRFFDIGLQERVPADPGPAREDWIEFIRNHLSPRYLRFDGGVALWRAFLVDKLGSLDRINSLLNRNWQRVENIRLPYYDERTTLDPGEPLRYLAYPPTKHEYDLLLEFVAGPMPIEHIRVATAENLYRNWLLDKYGSLDAVNTAYGTHETAIESFCLPAPATDWGELMADKFGVWRFTFTRAYSTAVDHILRHKRSLWNTAVYCTAVVLAALIVNPMCAYALSRFNLPGSYKVLLFLLATMAFPAEVTMIPNFLLLKSFPLLRIVLTIAGFLVGGLLTMALAKSQRIVYPLMGAIFGAAIGATVVTAAATAVVGLSGHVTLLNTYWALILPGVASGYSVFILKGFFDSLPQEIYESAVIDGAGELRIFARITLPMSKPVLAVIALWSFTAAYGSFTWALIICQDPEMWTLMVHLYQYQMVVDPSERLSALTLASLPTLFVFIIAQRVILKGIILPTYK